MPRSLRLQVSLLTVILLVTSPGFSQKSPYSSLETRPVKALSQEQMNDYLAGKGMSMALAAELNGYPGPKHVLDLADRLELTPDQKAETQKIMDAMQARAMELGKNVVEGERYLDSLFASRTITPALLSSQTAHLGQISAALRETHLKAHLHMMDILRPEQIRKYNQLRGYGEGGTKSPSKKHH